MSNFKRYDKYKDSGIEWIGEIPEGWEVKKLKTIGRLYSGNGFKEDMQGRTEGDYPFYKVSDINGEGKFATISSNYVNKADVKNNKWNIIPENSILFPKIGEALKKNHRKINICKCLIDNNMAALKADESLINFNYLYYLFCCINTEWFVNPGTVPSINNNNLKNSNIILPSKNEQISIANFLDQKTAEIDDLITDKEKLIELLQEKRQAVITEAVTKGLNPNVKMKDSGIEWIGEIPEGWRVSKIKYEALINKKTLSENTDDDFEIDYIDIGSVTSVGEINGIQSLSFKDAPSRARRVVSEGNTIVSTVRTYLKAIAFIENVHSNLVCSTGFAVLTPLSNIVPKYLFYLMRSEKYVNEIVRRSVGVSYPAVNASDIGVLECVLPSVREQINIVEYLDKCSKRINQLTNEIELQIQKLREYRQSLIFEAVTGKIDVRDYAAIS